MEIGFTEFKEEIAQPTTQDLLALLSSGQKAGILDSFAAKKSILQVKHEFHVHTEVVRYFYNKIFEIQKYAAKLMQGQVEDKLVDEEMTYIPSPTIQSAFTSNIVSKFSLDFNATQTTAILTKMIQCSKKDRSGTWTYYKAEIVK